MVKSTGIQFNALFFILVLHTAIYQLSFAARILLAIPLLPENQRLCLPTLEGGPVADGATAPAVDSGNTDKQA